MRERILAQHMQAGVTIIDPASTYIEYGVTIGRGHGDLSEREHQRENPPSAAIVLLMQTATIMDSINRQRGSYQAFMRDRREPH